jgi:EpsI family protein
VRKLAVPAFLLAQALGVWLVAGWERPPAPPDLALLPATLGEWRSLGEDPMPAATQASTNADRLLSRYYGRRERGAPAQFLVAWYRSQRGGDRQPHQPKICLLGTGWLPVSEQVARIATPSGTFTATRLLIVRRHERAAVLYWYQSRRRAVASEWESKFWLAVDAARDHRSDGALVRIVVPAMGGREKEAFDAATALARSVWPALCERWPA